MSRLPALRASRDFRRVYDDGRRARSDGVTVFVAPSQEGSRIGIVVPKRVGGAVERNRLKRRIRAVLTAADLEPGTDVVVRAGTSARGLDFQELENHVLRALRAVDGMA